MRAVGDKVNLFNEPLPLTSGEKIRTNNHLIRTHSDSICVSEKAPASMVVKAGLFSITLCAGPLPYQREGRRKG